jgi:DNA-binding transcriptional MerR regulator
MGTGGATMTDRRNLRAPDVQDLTGATYRQLDYWCRTYGICADRDTGQGTSRTFTITEARVVRALVLLGEHGVTVGTYARAIHAALHAQPQAEYVVVAEDKASAHVREQNAIQYVTGCRTVATLVPLRFVR